MSASKLNLKLKLNGSLKKKIEDEDSKSGGNDPRFLNYYDLKDNEKIKVLFVPDVNGEIWAKYKKHGPNMKQRGIKSIRCSYESSGEPCAACEVGFENLNLSKETNDKAYKEEAKKWFARDYTLMSVLVLETPIEIKESSDKNEVKLFLVPFAVEKLIKEAITEGVIEEDELCSTPFFIKKTTNGGGFAEYSNSYFARKAVTDDELAFFEDRKVEQFDYTNLDVVPDATTSAEMVEWVEKARAVLDGGSASDDNKEDKKESEPKKEVPKKESEIDEEGERHMGEGRVEEKEQEQENAPRSSGSSLRDRLKKLQNND